MEQKRHSARIITLLALFAALMVVGTYIRIPIGPVPVVLTNLFTVAAGAILGPLWGSLSVALYLLLGAIGLPVFSGGGGAALLIGPTGGFFLGYILGALAAGLITRRGKPSRLKDAVGLAVAFLVIYLPGLPWLKITLDIPWPRAFAAGCIPFLPGDALKAVVLFFLLRRLRKALSEFFPSRD